MQAIDVTGATDAKSAEVFGDTWAINVEIAVSIDGTDAADVGSEDIFGLTAVCKFETDNSIGSTNGDSNNFLTDACNLREPMRRCGMHKNVTLTYNPSFTDWRHLWMARL